MRNSTCTHAVSRAASMAALTTAALAASAAPVTDCAGLMGAHVEHTQITLAALRPAAAGVPEHCEVVGAINERVSRADGQTYAIKFRLRLPTSWNRPFFYAGGGGTDG